MWYSNLKNTFLSRRILHQHLIHLSHRSTSASQPAAQKSYWLLSQPLPHLRFNFFFHLRNVCHAVVNRFTRQTLPTVNRKHFFMNVLSIESLCPQKRKRTAERCSLVVHISSTVAIWLLKPASEHVMRVCYLDYNVAGLCCCPVIHIENLLRALQLFTSICECPLV
jgi:hypothetical protein